MHDFLFRNALIFDGTGGSAAINDVAVTDGRIAAIGPAVGTSAREVIAADGLALMPGIIDSHTGTSVRHAPARHDPRRLRGRPAAV